MLLPRVFSLMKHSPNLILSIPLILSHLNSIVPVPVFR